MVKKVCKNCKKEKDVAVYGKSEGLCHTCYKKLLWEPKSVECKRCKRMLPMHGKGLCDGCYNSVFHIDNIKIFNAKKKHNINSELYKKLMEKCVVCSFNKIVQIHHLDHNHKNDSENNLIGLCPNCHFLLHSTKYQKEIFDTLKTNGFKVPESDYSDGYYYKEKA